MIGLSDLAKWNQEGVEVARPIAPMAMYWQVNPEVQRMCAHIPMDGSVYGCIASLKAGTVLYRVYGIDQPYTPQMLAKVGSKALVPLGHLVLTSDGAKKSKFADEQVFFKHVFWAD